MQIHCITVGQFQVNTYLLTDESSGISAIVDTGETDELVRRIQSGHPDADIQKILLTHTHIDHAGALPDLQAAWPEAETVMPAADRPLFETLPYQGTMFGMPHLNRAPGRIDVEVHDGDRIMLGETELQVLSTPGHTPGQCCYYTDEDIIVGDTLFAGSIGRTDFPLSDPSLAVESLRRLLALPGHLRVHSGHGPVTTLARELQTNPFLGYLRRERGMPVGSAVAWAPGT